MKYDQEDNPAIRPALNVNDFGIDIVGFAHNNHPLARNVILWRSRDLTKEVVTKLLHEEFQVKGRLVPFPLRDPYLVNATIKTKKERHIYYVDTVEITIPAKQIDEWLASLVI